MLLVVVVIETEEDSLMVKIVLPKDLSVLSFQHPHGDSQPPVTPVLTDTTSFSSLCRHQAHR